MDRVDKILQNREYRGHLALNEKAEEDRIFCRHNMEHFLDVARIAALLNAEERLGIDREHIYAAALLHDIGRHVQYEDGTPHEAAGGELAPSILQTCGFDGEETRLITQAILDHRRAEIAGEDSLSGVLYRADKLSRACFCCKAREQCDWRAEKMNLTLRY